MNQWHVAARQPPHLAAMCAWEGAADWYRDASYHGGILSTFWEHRSRTRSPRYGTGRPAGPAQPGNGEPPAGAETFSDAELAPGGPVRGRAP